MANNINLQSAIKDIQTEKLDIETFVKNVNYQGDRDDILVSIRQRLVDNAYVDERSICCAMLREFNDKESLPLIWRLIADESTKGKRGSLVYAMENMNPIAHLEQLIELVVNDNFEVLCNAMNTIDNLNGSVDENIIENCCQKISVALTMPMPTWRKEALSLLLEEFDDE